MPTRHLDTVNGSDAADGLDNVGVSLTTATWTQSTKTLTQVGAFAGLTFFVGARIYISGGTGATVGLYTIATKVSNDAITLTADIAPGDLGTGDITSSSGPWLTLAYAVGATSAFAPGELLQCKNATIIPATTITFDASKAGSATLGLTRIIGVNDEWVYDGTKFIIDGSSIAAGSNASLGGNYFFLAGLSFINNGVAGQGGLTAPNRSYCRFYDCAFNNNVANGLSSTGLACSFIRCSFNNNGVFGINNPSNDCLFLACEFKGNPFGALTKIDSSVVVGCVFHDSSSGRFTRIQDSSTGSHILNSIFDSTGGTEAIQMANSAAMLDIIGCRFTNNAQYALTASVGLIFYDQVTGFNNPLGFENTPGPKYNNLDDIATDRNFINDSESGYVNEASDDFNLTDTANGRRVPMQVGAT